MAVVIHSLLSLLHILISQWGHPMAWPLALPSPLNIAVLLGTFNIPLLTKNTDLAYLQILFLLWNPRMPLLVFHAAAKANCFRFLKMSHFSSHLHLNPLCLKVFPSLHKHTHTEVPLGSLIRLHWTGLQSRDFVFSIFGFRLAPETVICRP